jgi:hypothetical protein
VLQAGPLELPRRADHKLTWDATPAASLLWLNPLTVEPLTQNAPPPFDPSDFRLCADICQDMNLLCRIECMMGGAPPEFSPADCNSHCAQVRNACMQEVCTGYSPWEQLAGPINRSRASTLRRLCKQSRFVRAIPGISV